MAGITLTNEMARGAAVLAGQGETIDVWVPHNAGTRFCHLTGCDEGGETVTLRCWKGDWACYSDVASIRVLIAPFVANRCLRAWARTQETAEQRQAREAAESTDAINLRLLEKYRTGARRRPSGRFAPDHVGAAGRL